MHKPEVEITHGAFNFRSMTGKCDVCGKGRNGRISHQKCAKIKQQMKLESLNEK